MLLSKVGLAKENTPQEFPCPSCACQAPTCLECVGYVPSYYNLQCACDLFVTADFLYWYAKEEKLSYATELTFVTVNSNLPTEDQLTSGLTTTLAYFGTAWTPGMRFGLGTRFPSDGWDLFAYWTSYQNEKKAHHSVPMLSFQANSSVTPNDKGIVSNYCLLSPLPKIGAASIIDTDKAQAEWKFHLNTLDIELGKRACLSTCFNIRSFLALRRALTTTQFSVTMKANISDPLEGYTARGFSKWKNSFEGIGPLVGLQPFWCLSKRFSLFSSFDIALLWGLYKNKVNTTTFVHENNPFVSSNFNENLSTPTARDRVHSMQAVGDLTLGLRYERKLCKQRYQLSFDAAWEQHVWLNHVQRISPLSAEGLLFLDDTVSLAGLVIRGVFDF